MGYIHRSLCERNDFLPVTKVQLAWLAPSCIFCEEHRDNWIPIMADFTVQRGLTNLVFFHGRVCAWWCLSPCWLISILVLASLFPCRLFPHVVFCKSRSTATFLSFLSDKIKVGTKNGVMGGYGQGVLADAVVLVSPTNTGCMIAVYRDLYSSVFRPCTCSWIQNNC